uniref:Uncharacterized protein n=1 Tax=Periophthalmus magnuspinnatus TaxID=409849 RepID=A0A3B3ZLP1_9GOBI
MALCLFSLTHQEQVLAQSQGGWLSPAGSEGKPVDIIQMLSKARNEYDKEKSSSEPKEIGGSSVLYGNPNLINIFVSFKPNRPHVVRTLTYENTTRPGQNDNPGERPGHCPAIQKLMQGQRGTLQTVSESPENRLSDNGHHFVEHHQGFHQTPPHHLHHHHHHHHHHNVRQPQPVPPQLQPQTQLDAIKRLFQSQPPVAVAPQSFTVSRNPAVPQPAPVQPAPVQPAPVFSQHQNQPFVFSTSEEGQQNRFSGQMAGVVSPHELLQKLQIVQQEQSRASSDPPQPGPALAPRFMGPSHTDPRDPGLNQVPNQRKLFLYSKSYKLESVK